MYMYENIRRLDLDAGNKRYSSVKTVNEVYLVCKKEEKGTLICRLDSTHQIGKRHAINRSATLTALMNFRSVHLQCIYFSSSLKLYIYRPRNACTILTLITKQPFHDTEHFPQAVNIFSYFGIVLFCSVCFPNNWLGFR